MIDRYGRRIDYLRVSVTDRCNLRCRYCMGEGGIGLLPRESILSFEEIRSMVRVSVKEGIDKVRLTGGEPLARKDIALLVGILSEIDGIKDLSMTTNGLLLKELAGDLKRAGLGRVNVSLDTVDPARFRWITRGGDLRKVLRGIDAAEDAGLLPIKINCVVKGSFDDPEALRVKAFCERRKFTVRFIREMDLQGGQYAVVEGGTGGDCRTCNRLRLSCDGSLRPCLFNDLSFDVRTLGAEKAIRMAVAAKPERGTRSFHNKFHSVGG